MNEKEKIYIILERWNNAGSFYNQWRRGWHKKWYLTKESAEGAKANSEKNKTENNLPVEYKVVEIETDFKS